MLYRQNRRVLNRRRFAIVAAFLLGVALCPRITTGETLEELVARAKQEGALNGMIASGLTGKTAEQLSAAYKKRFGLQINVTLTPLLNTQEYPKAIAAVKAGTVPTYDVLEGSDTINMALMGVGGVRKIDNWERLLADINPLVKSGRVPADRLSPGPLRGFAFAYLSRTKALLYNPKLISKDRLPRRHADLADPRFKGMFTVAPWTTPFEPGPLAFPEIGKEGWVELVRKIGKNAGAVLEENAGVQRMLLGEYSFLAANTYYYFRYKTKDPQAPVEITYMTDYNVSSRGVYIVQTNARHPAAGTLFALWMGSPEAESIWQAHSYNDQLWGDSKLDRDVRQFIERSGANILDLMDTQKGVDFLNWLSTDEGRNYKEALGRAIRGG